MPGLWAPCAGGAHGRSDARVDVGTKQEVYHIIREEAAAGRTFIWYSTEMEEVCLCDRVYVFRRAPLSELAGSEVNENNILAASFEEKRRDKFP